MSKNAIYLAKNAVKNQTLPISNAYSEAAMWDINAIQVLSGV